MKARTPLAQFAGCLGGLLFGCSVHAGALAVSPTRLELSAAHPVAVLQVSNEGGQPVIVQLDRMEWSQHDGEDVYTASNGLLATPTVFELAPHGRQVVRVAYRKGGDDQERAYRVYASEVEEEQPSGGTGVRMLVRIGVPVFVESKDATSSIDGSIIRRNDGSAAVLLRNGGPHFKHTLGLAIRDGSQTTVWELHSAAYLLAKGGHQWTLDAPAASLVEDDTHRLAILTEAGLQDIDLPHGP